MPTESPTKMTFFFGQENSLSNWHPARFVVKGIEFNNVEQFMMFCKAMLFKDKETAAKIMAAATPREQKALGRSVRGFVEELWIQKREAYVERGCLAKFSQNPSMLEVLLATEGTDLVEASPYDKIWGAGLASCDPRILDRSQWPGDNLLGTVLGRARSKLLAERIRPAPDHAALSAAPAAPPRFHLDGTAPSDGEVFVFGSNLAGRHGKGSALAAKQRFGAVYGLGEGPQGRSYAIPTKDGRPGTPFLGDPKATLPLAAIRKSVEAFLTYARAHSSARFFVVRLGCDLAAHKDSDIAPMFASAPSNCSFPQQWSAHIPNAPVEPNDPDALGKTAPPRIG